MVLVDGLAVPLAQVDGARYNEFDATHRGQQERGNTVLGTTGGGQ
jgi:hypothetical protein